MKQTFFLCLLIITGCGSRTPLLEQGSTPEQENVPACERPARGADDWIHDPACFKDLSDVSCPQQDGTTWSRLKDSTIIHWSAEGKMICILYP